MVDGKYLHKASMNTAAVLARCESNSEGKLHRDPPSSSAVSNQCHLWCDHGRGRQPRNLPDQQLVGVLLEV